MIHLWLMEVTEIRLEGKVGILESIGGEKERRRIGAAHNFVKIKNGKSA